MLRGLVIKQVFFVVDLLLMAVIGIALVFAVLRFMDTGKDGLGAPVAAAEAGDGIEYAGLSERSFYDVVNANKLFGEAGQRRITTLAEPEEPVSEEITQTQLQLTLLGCTSIGPTDPYSCATIVNVREADTRKKERVYFVGQTIMSNVVLSEVHKRYVILKKGNQFEYLPMDKSEDTKITLASAQPQQNAAPTEQTAPGVVTFKRQDLLQEMMQAENLETIAATARDVTDDNGNVIGVTADGIGEVELATKLGFSEGDVVQQINGQPVQGVDNLGELLQKFSDMNSFRISVLRDGQPKMLTIRLQ